MIEKCKKDITIINLKENQLVPQNDVFVLINGKVLFFEHELDKPI